MPTVRRLFNKKAYEEMVLLQKRCDIENEKAKQFLVPMLKVSETFREQFEIWVFTADKKTVPSVIKLLKGRTYTEIEKELSRFINGN